MKRIWIPLPLIAVNGIQRIGRADGGLDAKPLSSDPVSLPLTKLEGATMKKVTVE